MGRDLLERGPVDLDHDARALKRDQHRGERQIATSPAAAQRLGHLRLSQLRYARRHSELASERRGNRHVLVAERERERRRIVAVRQGETPAIARCVPSPGPRQGRAPSRDVVNS